MGKVITSPVKAFPGTVTLHDPLTWPQAIAFEDGFKAARDLEGSQFFLQLVKAVIPCVEAWHLENFPNEVGTDNFPSTPRKPAGNLIIWLANSVNELYEEGEAIPNA